MGLKMILAILLVISTFHEIVSSTSECQDSWDGIHFNKTVKFSMVSRKNKTGHWITNFSLINAARKLPMNWMADINHKVIKDGGLEVFHLQGKLIVPPSIPNDYQLYPGVGYYKYHSNTLTFDEANKKCAEEGAHLAIINSEAEHQVIKSLVTKGTAYLGFHDQIKEGEFITIFGEPLAATGFMRWAPNQPDDSGGKEDCGTYWAGQGLNDIPCNIANFFVCEYDLAWAE